MYKDVIERLCEAGLFPEKTIAETKASTGKELVGCFPVRTPEEIIYASGCIPVGMWGGKAELKLSDKYLQGFCCAVMRTNLEFAMRGVYDCLKAVVMPTFCDSMKCMVENWKLALPDKPLIAFAYPQHTKIPAGFQFTIDEIKRVRHELELILKKIITTEAVEEAYEVYEDYRKTMREFTALASEHPSVISSRKRHLIIKAGNFMDKAEYTGLVKEINEGLRSEGPDSFKGKRAVVTGLMCEPVEILDIMDDNGLAIVGDDLSLGSRLWRTPGREGVEDVFERMAYMIRDIEGDTFFYDKDKTKGAHLIEMVKDLKADCVVVMMQKFCDPEEYDYPIYKAELAEAGIPELYLEFDQQVSTFEQIRTRVQSFSEMLI